MRQAAMPIDVIHVSLKQLMDKAHDLSLKRVLLTSYGSVEPVRDPSALVLAGMTTVTATLFDGSDHIYRWEQKGRSKGIVTIRAGTGRGNIGAGEPVARLRQDVYELLRNEGFEVDDGEWTPDSAGRFLASRLKLIG
jgi:hypothetical protein